jgi:hypothetical protein
MSWHRKPELPAKVERTFRATKPEDLQRSADAVRPIYRGTAERMKARLFI